MQDQIGMKWLSIILDRINVDIVIPSYKFHPGVKFCIDSIRACTNVPYKVIVVNNGTDPQLDQYLDQQKDIFQIKQSKLNFAKAVNIGIKAGKGTHICILNDDVIVSRGWLQELINSCTRDIGAVGPLSNCDQGWLHSYNLNIGGVELRPGTNTYQEIEPIIPQIYDFKSPYNEKPQRDWVAFYCTLIPRDVINKVGVLNDEFTNSGEDVDYCNRIRNCGYRIIQNYRSFIFHYGAISRKLKEQEDFGSYHEADKKTTNHLHYLWNRKSVMIYSGPAWERWDYRNLETTGIGGSEIWQTWLSRKLSELGYRVTVFADCPETGIKDGDVLWLHYTDYSRWAEQHWTDYVILSRTTDPLRIPLRAGKVYIQIHDVWMLSDRNQLFLDKVTKYCALSDWHLDFASEYHGIPKDRMAIMANGIDLKRFDDITVERSPYRLHWSSSWDRGLDNVLYLWPFIKQEISEAELHCFYGIYNWKKSCELKNDQEGLKKIKALEEAVKQPGVFTYGRVSQKILAEEIKKASLWLYPSWFSETFCCLPDNRIFTDRGFKPIIDVSLRNNVLTHKNRFRPITKIMSRKFTGQVFSLKIKNQMHDTGFFTGEHPILILTERDVKKLRGFKNQDYKRGVISSKWVPIKDVKIGDFVCFPSPMIVTEEDLVRDFLADFKKINRNYKEVNGRICYRDHDRYKGIPRYMKMDSDFARFLGLYFAEGYSSNGSITFVFNVKENEYIIFVESMFKKMGVATRRQKQGNALNIIACCNSLSIWLKYFFGSNESDKNVPIFLYQMSKDFIFSFLKGALDGNDCVGFNDIKIQLASESGVLNLKMLMQMIGLYPFYLRPEKKPTLAGEERVYYSVSISRGQWFRYIKDWNKKTQNTFFRHGNDVFFRVRNIEKKMYDGLVYNMEVVEDNSYVSGFQAVHNCITGVEAQYSGVPVICNRYAGIITTLGDSAIMLGNGDAWWPYTKEGREQFLVETISILKDRNKWQEWSDKSKENAKKYSWENCALRWKALFEE